MEAGPRLRENQRRRTRKDLLRAAAELLREGARPTLAEVAERAMLSRATAYRYFSSIEALLAEAPIDGVAPDPSMFADDRAASPPGAPLRFSWFSRTAGSSTPTVPPPAKGPC